MRQFLTRRKLSRLLRHIYQARPLSSNGGRPSLLFNNSYTTFSPMNVKLRYCFVFKRKSPATTIEKPSVRSVAH